MKTLTLLAILFFLTSCNHRTSEVENAASALKRNMDKNEVKTVFSKCVLFFETNEVQEISVVTTAFETNSISASVMMYKGKPGFISSWDACVIYFGKNDRIISYKYENIK